MLKTIFFVGFGGAVGSVFRYLLSGFISKIYLSNFPLATYVVNIVGCFLIGILMGIFAKYNLQNSDLKWLLITGFCGGFTTFSAFGYENFNLFQTHNYFLSLIYICLSVFFGIFAVGLGLFLSK